MPTAALRPCMEPKCPALLSSGSRCAAHTRPPRRTPDMRASPSARGYDRAWQRIRAAVLAEDPDCRTCGAAAVLVDHIVPIRSGGSNDRLNLQPLCTPCHNRKTAAEGGGWKRRLT